jgi:putative transposase
MSHLVEELMEECGVAVGHATLQRWVVQYSPLLEEAFHRRKRPVWVRWYCPGIHDQETVAGG